MRRPALKNTSVEFKFEGGGSALRWIVRFDIREAMVYVTHERASSGAKSHTLQWFGIPLEPNEKDARQYIEIHKAADQERLRNMME